MTYRIGHGGVCARCQEPPLREPRLSPLKVWLQREQSSSCGNHSCGSRNPSLGRGEAPPHLPPLGYPRARARRRPTVFPAKLVLAKRGAGIHPWDAGEARPHLPLLGTRVAGTTWFHRHSCEACPRGNGEQESIPGTGERPSPIAPLWVPASAGTTWFHRHSCESRNPSLGRGRGPGPPSPLWVPACAGTTWFHRHSCEACPRGNGEQESIPTIAQIPLASRPKSACKSLTRPRPLLYHSVQSFPEQGARPWKTLGAVVPARGCRTISERTYT